jgi:hypothetical protein
VFNSNGDFYVGHASGDQDIQRYDSAGTFIQKFNVTPGPVGSDWIDLAADQTTMFYCSEGQDVRRYDVGSDVQLTDFANGLGGAAFALRLLPPFDGTGGLIVANLGAVVRLDGSGAIVQSYDATNENAWFSANLDPNGTSFWAGDFNTSNFYRFNIQSGAVEIGPINTGTGPSSLFGIAVVGEITGGVNNPPTFDAPSPCGLTFDLGVGIPFSYVVAASDPNPGDTVLLEASGVPAGASHNPALPLQGAPDQAVSTTFNWTPANGDVGSRVVTYTATDSSGESSTCSVTLRVAECHTILGSGRGRQRLNRGGYEFHTQVKDVYETHPVLLDDIPVFEVPVPPPGSGERVLVGEFAVQTVMYNPQIFPDNVEQSTPGLYVKVWSNGEVTTVPFGTRDGMSIRVRTHTTRDGRHFYAFPFSIDGM